MNYRESDKSIVLLILGIISLEEKRDLYNTALVKETLAIRSDRKEFFFERTKYNGNKISKNKRNIYKQT